jgi:hypothetical protein
VTDRRTLFAVFAALLVSGLSAGCSSSRSPVPAEPSASVPGIGGTARFRADPCAAVTVEQLTALGSAGGERGSAQGLVDT